VTPPFDQRLANEAAAVDHCVKLGGVVLPSKAPAAGFAPASVDSVVAARAADPVWRDPGEPEK
jgi:hypothetical protein